MMMRLLFLFGLVSTTLQAQSDSLIESYRLSVSDQVVWTADVLGNLYTIDKDVLVKYDTTGQKRYSQSIKSSGRISQIQCQSSMRVWLFSQDQQTLSVTDNTLTSQQQLYDLNELGYEYVTLFCVSAQANKAWVYDEVNSTLVFHDFVRNEKRTIENIKGILRTGKIVQIKEIENQLFLRDDQHHVFVVDRFGSLVDRFDIPECTEVVWAGVHMILLQNGNLVGFDRETNKTQVLYPSLTHVEGLCVEYPNLFVKTSKKLVKYLYK